MSEAKRKDDTHFGCNKCCAKILRVYIVESLFYCEICVQKKRDEFRLRDAIAEFDLAGDQTIE